MPTEGKGPIVIPCYLVDGVPYVLEVDAAGKLAMRAAEIETLLGAGLPAALDSLALKVKEQSPLTGFATSAKQDTMITALQLIDDLRAALGSVNTDDLQVDVKTMPTVTVQAAGGDKIFSLESVVANQEALTATAVDELLSGQAVPTGKLWVITYIAITLINRAPTRLAYYLNHDGTWVCIQDELRTLVINRTYGISGHWYLDADDYLAALLYGMVVGDTVYFGYGGYQMDAP